MRALSALFPNMRQLRLGSNYDTDNFEYLNANRGFHRVHCLHCCAHTREIAQQRGNEYDFQVAINSSTADQCKATFVRQALAALPKLEKISLQIEDFSENALRRGFDLKYLYMSETLIVRDAATGEPVPEDAWQWTVEKVLF